MVSFERTYNYDKRSTFNSMSKRMTNNFEDMSQYDSPGSAKWRKSKKLKVQALQSDASPFAQAFVIGEP